MIFRNILETMRKLASHMILANLPVYQDDSLAVTFKTRESISEHCKLHARTG